MSSHLKTGHRCTFENLESRCMLAGNVSAQIVKGNLVLKGDNSNNVIEITSTTTGSITITGTSTNVNSLSTPVTLSGFTGNIQMNLKGGNDDATFTNLTTRGIDADMGDGL